MTIYEALRDAIQHYVFDSCRDTDITKQRQQELVKSYTRLIEDLTEKYVAGHIKHQDESGDITEIDLDREIHNELLDLIHYHEAKLWKRPRLSD